ncbi:hypothetical protein [Dendrosporobacter sp. 1207_IL3150]|uniref:hypothetical protein n=1 Tax=Dendrosporobacter sp. 1207_IL3150 TaxID=3084054 RepID=UPI002FD9687E
MADFKQHMSRHLQSAKQWLTRAEESFDKQSDIRGELDLMLAQAELQHAKEAKRAGEWRYKYFVMRHGFAFGLAMLVAVGGLGGAFFLLNGQALVPPSEGQRPANSVKLNEPKVELVSSEKTLPQEPFKELSNSALIAEKPAPIQAQPTSFKTTDRQEVKREPRRSVADEADSAVELPPDQMQKLMRAAGKSLRGQ